MKTADSANIWKIAGHFSHLAMLAAMATLTAHFIGVYMTIITWVNTVIVQLIFNCSWAPRRISKRIVHLRKFALFQRYGGQGFTT